MSVPFSKEKGVSVCVLFWVQFEDLDITSSDERIYHQPKISLIAADIANRICKLVCIQEF